MTYRRLLVDHNPHFRTNGWKCWFSTLTWKNAVRALRTHIDPDFNPLVWHDLPHRTDPETTVTIRDLAELMVRIKLDLPHYVSSEAASSCCEAARTAIYYAILDNPSVCRIVGIRDDVTRFISKVENTNSVALALTENYYPERTKWAVKFADGHVKCTGQIDKFLRLSPSHT